MGVGAGDPSAGKDTRVSNLPPESRFFQPTPKTNTRVHSEEVRRKLNTLSISEGGRINETLTRIGEVGRQPRLYLRCCTVRRRFVFIGTDEGAV